MEHTAKVDMLLSCKLTPKNLKSYRKNGRTNREKSTASHTEEHSGNHAKRWTWSVKDLESWMVSLRPFQALSILLTATIIMMTAGKCIHIQQSAWEKWSNGGRKLDITSSNARIIRLKVSCLLTMTKTIQLARKLSLLCCYFVWHDASQDLQLLHTLYGQEDMLFKKHKFENKV